jgi:hypothetical protein
MNYKLMIVAGSLVTGIFVLSGFTAKRPAVTPIPAATIRQAAEKGLSLLEKSGYLFTRRSKPTCASCHHNSLTSMAAAIAREKEVPVTDSFTKYRVIATVQSLAHSGNPNLIDDFLTVNFAAPYFLLALHADRYPPDFHTDLAVDYLISQARPDGRFQAETGRIPLESGDIHLTALAIRAIRLYAAPAKTGQVNRLVERTRKWLEASHPDQQQEFAFQLLGLYWCGSSVQDMEKTAAILLSLQNPDGGWSQMPTLGSDAYATGQMLYALYESGMLHPEDQAYQKGIGFLLNRQGIDGGWVVMTRSFPIQPFFSSDFPPYDENQYISAAASNWSEMALLNALPDHPRHP